MNTETTATTTPTIAELWRELQETLKADFLRTSQSNNDAHNRYLRTIERSELLRAQLSDRLELPPWSMPKPSPSHDLNEFINGLREVSAAYAFWAWEIEQGQKEAHP